MFSEATPPDKIPDSLAPKGPVEGEAPLRGTPSTFESYMQGSGAAGTPLSGQVPAQSGAQAPTPMDLARGGTAPTAAPTVNSLLVQSKTMQDSLGTVGQQLNSPNLKLKRSQSHLLKNKLQDANGYIRNAASTLGVENPPMGSMAGMSPAARFLAMLGDGQDQLMAVQQKLGDLSSQPGGINPGDMLQIQVKMAQAQQEIEYSSTLLGKVIQSFTQLMQTQL